MKNTKLLNVLCVEKLEKVMTFGEEERLIGNIKYVKNAVLKWLNVIAVAQ